MLRLPSKVNVIERKSGDFLFDETLSARDKGSSKALENLESSLSRELRFAPDPAREASILPCLFIDTSKVASARLTPSPNIKASSPTKTTAIHTGRRSHQLIDILPILREDLRRFSDWITTDQRITTPARQKSLEAPAPQGTNINITHTRIEV
jgi:hypothetical protein